MMFRILKILIKQGVAEASHFLGMTYSIRKKDAFSNTHISRSDLTKYSLIRGTYMQ